MKRVFGQGTVGLLTALAILPGLSGCNKTIDWLFDAPAQSESVQASGKTEASVETAVPMSVAASPAAAAPVSKAADSGPTTESEIRSTLNAWRDAWAARDVDAYLSFYTPNFKGREVGPANWQASRKRVIAQAGKIELTLGEPKIVVDSLNQATVTFSQNYRSQIRSDKGIKKLQLRRSEGHWLIEEESFLPAKR